MTALATRPLETRKAEAASVWQSHGVPHRRIEEWKYSDLKAALGEKGIGAIFAEWQVQSLPAGVEMFDLSLPNPPDWVKEHFAASTGNVMGAASLALSSARDPRSVTRAAAISAMMSSTESAGDSTMPVLMMSPMVRTRTTRSLTCSLSLGGSNSVTGSHWPLRRTHFRGWLK